MDREIVRGAIEGIEAGRVLALAVVVSTRGSTPRKAGAALLAGPEGLFRGTVGGGALEARVLAVAARVASGGGASLVRFDLEGRAVSEAEPICGGEAEIAVLRISDPLPFEAAEGLVSRRRCAIFALALDEGGSERPALAAVMDEAGKLAWGSCEPEAAALLKAKGGRTLIAAGRAIAYDPVLPPERLLVLGGGHVGKALAALALDLGFEVTVADPRAEFAAPSALPSGVAVLRGEYADVVEDFAPGERDFAVIVSPGHRGDLEAARALLARSPDYIGMIGSRRKTRMILDQLAAEGCEPERVARLCAPIGLDIGAETPEEIAVSIAAELIAYRRGGPCLTYLHEERVERRNRPYS